MKAKQNTENNNNNKKAESIIQLLKEWHSWFSLMCSEDNIIGQ